MMVPFPAIVALPSGWEDWLYGFLTFAFAFGAVLSFTFGSDCSFVFLHVVHEFTLLPFGFSFITFGIIFAFF